MHIAYRIRYRQPYQAIDTRPFECTILACDEQQARRKFRKFRPNCEIVEIIQR